MKLEIHGHIKQGKLSIVNRRQFDSLIGSILDMSVNILITKKRKKRSTVQNKYYWGCVVSEIQTCLTESQGEFISSDDTHEFLKSRFNCKDLVNKNNGEIVPLPISTTELTTLQFEEYIDKCRAFALEFFKCEIALPNEQSEMQLS